MYAPVWSWLVHAAIGSCVLLSVGALVLLYCRQPIQRVRIIQWTLLGCLLLPWMGQIPGFPKYSTGWLPSEAETGNQAATNGRLADDGRASNLSVRVTSRQRSPRPALVIRNR